MSTNRGSIKKYTLKSKSGKAKLYQGAGFVVRQPRLTYRPVKETGFVDTGASTGTAYAMDTTGSVTLLSAVAQGASQSQRVGKKIMLRSLQGRGAMGNLSTAVTNDVAFMIVYDKRPTGALPSITDILVAASSLSLNNDANAGRFTILKRHDDVLVGNQTAAANYTEAMYKSADFYLPLKGLQTVYKAAGTGAIADHEEGALYLVTLGNNAGTAAATLNLALRLRFVDM